MCIRDRQRTQRHRLRRRPQWGRVLCCWLFFIINIFGYSSYVPVHSCMYSLNIPCIFPMYFPGIFFWVFLKLFCQQYHNKRCIRSWFLLHRWLTHTASRHAWRLVQHTQTGNAMESLYKLAFTSCAILSTMLHLFQTIIATVLKPCLDKAANG